MTFSNGLPALDFTYSKGIFIADAGNVDGKRGNEILLFSRTNEGWWNNLYVYTLRQGKWLKLATGKAFCSDDIDFKNRIILKKEKAYLVIDKFDEKSAAIKKEKVAILQ